MEVHQFHSGSAYGDAITNQMLALRALLRQEGYASEIYVEHVDGRLAAELKPIHQYKGHSNNVLLIHHSMGFEGFQRIVALSDVKILIYHNITPERFFDDETTRGFIRLGRFQLAAYLPHLAHAIADSNYNRHDMRQAGYRDVDVMPVQTNLHHFLGWNADKKLLKQLAGPTNWLFVGRVIPNKCQEDVIRAFAHYSHFHNSDARLYLVGDTGLENYARNLARLAEELGVGERVTFTGKVSKEALKAYYQAADVFVCMSEHEGFCVPLLEAMAMNVPVLAYRASAIPETMAGAGILLDSKQPELTASLVEVLLGDSDFKSRLVERQKKRISALATTDTRQILLGAIQKALKPGKKSLQIQGPFETSYSLAIVNRHLAEALHQAGAYEVSILATEGPGDYIPQAADLADKPLARELWEKAARVPYPYVVIRNMWPPRVEDAPGMFNFLNFAWEESRVPARFVASFNRYLDGIGVPSEFVRDALVSSGVKVPIRVLGNGVCLPPHYEALKPYALPTQKTFKFLNISSAFPRKGVDVLLKAYFEAFSGEDDVVLVLKTFPNPHNHAEEQLAEQRAAHPNPPEVMLINQDLPGDALYALYQSADCYVHAGRGEGFGLPVAEAMLARVPVLVSANTGLADFCGPATAITVGYTLEPSRSHIAEAGSLWAEPDVQALARAMRRFVDAPESLDLNERVEAAQHLIASRYSWRNVAAEWHGFISDTLNARHRPEIALVTSWNSRCGIAEYSKFLVEATQRRFNFAIYANEGVDPLRPELEKDVSRVWMNRWQGGLSRLHDAVMGTNAQAVHLQFNFGYFDLGELSELIKRLAPYKKVIITFHATKDCVINGQLASLGAIREALELAACLIVHQQEDLRRLQALGLFENVILIPQGNPVFPPQDKLSLRRALGIAHAPVIATFGFLLPHKGVREVIRAVEILKASYPSILFLAVCALHFDSTSHAFHEECQNEIARRGLSRNVVLITDFIEPDEAMALLQSADAVLLPYHPTEESSSAALRFCLASGRPTLTTRQPIFQEATHCTQPIEACSPESIAEAVRALLEDSGRQAELSWKMALRVEETSWQRVGEQYASELERVLASKPKTLASRVEATAPGDEVGRVLDIRDPASDAQGIHARIRSAIAQRRSPTARP